MCLLLTLESSSILEEEEVESQQFNLYLNVQYNGLENLNNVQENYEIGFGTVSEEQIMQYDYKININTQFADSLEIEDLNGDIAIFLNDYEGEKVTNFLTQVGTRLLAINKSQMEKLGLKEYENPLLFTNPITMIVINFANIGNENVPNIESQLEENVTSDE